MQDVDIGHPPVGADDAVQDDHARHAGGFRDLGEDGSDVADLQGRQEETPDSDGPAAVPRGLGSAEQANRVTRGIATRGAADATRGLGVVGRFTDVHDGRRGRLGSRLRFARSRQARTPREAVQRASRWYGRAAGHGKRRDDDCRGNGLWQGTRGQHGKDHDRAQEAGVENDRRGKPKGSPPAEPGHDSPFTLKSAGGRSPSCARALPPSWAPSAPLTDSTPRSGGGVPPAWTLSAGRGRSCPPSMSL
jgi:hypothetical protein